MVIKIIRAMFGLSILFLYALLGAFFFEQFNWVIGRILTILIGIPTALYFLYSGHLEGEKWEVRV